jgi:hypothetical protein
VIGVRGRDGGVGNRDGEGDETFERAEVEIMCVSARDDTQGGEIGERENGDEVGDGDVNLMRDERGDQNGSVSITVGEIAYVENGDGGGGGREESRDDL